MWLSLIGIRSVSVIDMDNRHHIDTSILLIILKNDIIYNHVSETMSDTESIRHGFYRKRMYYEDNN
jgi:hypothetical protein